MAADTASKDGARDAASALAKRPACCVGTDGDETAEAAADPPRGSKKVLGASDAAAALSIAGEGTEAGAEVTAQRSTATQRSRSAVLCDAANL
jgi:hypothetical protein